MLLFLYLIVIFLNNKVGGDFINKYKLNFFWKVGKFTVEKRFLCENIVKRCSSYLAYYFGNSSMFSYENIIFMKKFYLYFPIFIDVMNDLDWNSYIELLSLNDKKMCYFYYNLSLFCKFNYDDLKRVIDNEIYFRI